MEYNFKKIEKLWQEKWKTENIYKVSNTSDKPKCYVLDMFPYPSGAGLHVGHPLGYIASDIYARFKRLKGFNVLHPMGYDSFGLPAEQYALETGQHPATTTQNNIATFRSQLENIGFSFDWSREVRTSDPSYYRWTQWIFLQIFNSWYDHKKNKARPINELIEAFEKEGNGFLKDTKASDIFSADDWKNFDEKHQQEILMQYRLAYTAYGEVNWCAALGTVLANDEVINGVSERGGYPVEKKQMRQWYMRITAYAERLLQGLDTVAFSDAMKEMQKNWIGKSEGAEIDFPLSAGGEGLGVRVYTTRPDTIFGVDFMVLAPEHVLVSKITTAQQQIDIDEYLQYVKSRSERERLAEVKQITGAFTGAHAVNPFDGRLIPIWISEYVLAGYGTGAIMAVPCGDQRDFSFAKHFNIPITNIIGEHFTGKEANPTKEAYLSNSGFLDGMLMRDAISVATASLQQEGLGKRKVNYKMHDAGFSRQRYWGEPFPIIYKDGIPYPVDEKDLPVELPHVESYSPGPEGQGPLANIKEWVLIPSPSPSRPNAGEKGEAKGAALVAKYKVSSPFQYELAKQMRKEYTEAENILWQELRNNKLGVTFRRQHPVESYIADFIALQNNLVVEVDGGYHESEEQKMYDEERTKVLAEIGFKVLRFTNNDVIHNLKDVLTNIRKETSPLIPSPLVERGQGVRETNTMPGYAGSSWYFLRYMDPYNEQTFADKTITDYWNQVDVYVGGTEHAVGHLLYSRMWTKVLCDLGYISFDEPFKKLVNQGMIQGSSRFVYRVDKFKMKNEKGNWFEKDLSIYDPIFISQNRINNLFTFGKGVVIIDDTEENYQILGKEIGQALGIELSENNYVGYSLSDIHVNVDIVDGTGLDIDTFRKSKPEYAKAMFILEDGSVNSPLSTRGEGLGVRYICGVETEKMSKSKYNTVNPDVLIEKYGADTFRMYEMFLGPVEQSKPWDTKGIEGVHRFLRKLWRLFYDDVKGKVWDDDNPNNDELKILHRTIKKIEEDTEQFSYNTAVSAFMVCVNELADIKSHKKTILEQLLILLAPYAPHIAEELYQQLHKGIAQEKFVSILDAQYPVFEPSYLVESEKEYTVSINGKMRTTINISLDAEQSAVEQIVLNNEVVQKWIAGKSPKKIIYVKNKMVNIVV